MESHLVFSGWDTILLAVPFAALLMMAMFGLDEHVTGRPKARSERPRAFCHPDAHGEIVLCDPDGRIWQDAPKKALGTPALSQKSRRWYVIDEETTSKNSNTVA